MTAVEKRISDSDTATFTESASVEVIEVSQRAYARARHAALNELGLTYNQLRSQASRGQFSSLRARKLWLAIGAK